MFNARWSVATPQVVLLSRKMNNRFTVLLKCRHLVAEGLRQVRIDLQRQLSDTSQDILDFQGCLANI